MTFRTLCVALLLAHAPCLAQTIQLSDGQVLLASVEDVDGQGLRVRRLDNGGMLDLRWEHLSADSAQRIKAAHDLGGETQDEVMVTAELVKYKLNGTPTEVIGRIVNRTPTHIVMLRKGVEVQVPKDAGLLIQTVEVPALQVFTKEEYYGKRLNDLQPGESSDKHVQLAQELIKVRDYDHASEHLEAAAKHNNSKDPNQITLLKKKLELYREAQAERDLLDQIQASRARTEFPKGLELIAKYKQQFEKGKLRAEFDSEVKRFGEARQKFLTGKVADQWRRIIRSTAERKVMEVGVTLAQAREYATSKMADDICARVAGQLQLTPEETRTLWNERAKYQVGKHPELFSYGLGSFVLGEKDILKDTKQGKENAKQAPKDAANDRDIERINKLIQAARARMAQSNTGNKQATPEDWWLGADTNQRAGWLRAFYAEYSGTMVLTAAYLQDCPTCAGEGTVPEVVDGKVIKQPCYLCQNTKYLRSFNAYEMVRGTVALLLAAACAGAPRGPADVNAVEAAASGGAREPVVAVLPQGATQQGEFGPEVLLPDPALGDEVVATVGSSTLRRSHAFARLLTADPRIALSAVDLLVFDVLVAGHAREFEIRVDPAKVKERAGKEEAQVRAQVKTELGEGLQFEDYVWRTFGMKIEDWRRTGELRVAQRLYHGYVIRYLALREERVTVRYIVHQDQAVLEGLATKVKEGADFATLALRHSEDTLRRDGGLLPPFGRGFPHPAADIAFTLQPGQLSAVTTRETQNGPRHFLVYCLERRSGRDVKFADVYGEIDAELLNKPLSPIETNAYTLRWRAAMERKDAAPQEKHDTRPSGR